ncbi:MULTISPECIES: transaldolase [Helicobacter]|uniref:transaldolase n=1 Tax=Helicobacter TaxID=209 RepID=UPI000EB5BB7B|nr:MULTISPECIES: transaldolase [Helicobacter]
MQDFYLWCDFIERDFLEGEFRTLLDQGQIAGATSNPTLFAQAIKSGAYTEQIAKLKGAKMGVKDIYEHLVITDIKRCAQLLLPLWEQNKATGYISLEIDPFLAEDVGASVAEARALFDRINMPNVMIKIPATQVGLEVMEHLAKSKDMPLNATLVFEPDQAHRCVSALKSAPMGVVSIFVSRVDTLVNQLLQQESRLSAGTQAYLRNQMGIINALKCREWVRACSYDNVYPLFASTGVKDPNLPKDYYLQALKLEHSVITAPLDALEAYHKHPSTPFTPSKHTKTILQDLGLNLKNSPLLDQGLKAFQGAFEALLQSLA